MTHPDPTPDETPAPAATAVSLDSPQSTVRRVVYRGRDLPVLFHRAHRMVAVPDDGLEFPDAVDRGTRPTSPTGRWVTVPLSRLQRHYTRAVTATWRGRRVSIDLVTDGPDGRRAGFWLLDMDRPWALANGLGGSQHEGGFSGVADVSEFTDVIATEHDRAIPTA